MNSLLSIATEENQGKYAGYDFLGSKESAQSNSKLDNEIQFDQFRSEYRNFFISRKKGNEEEFKLQI